MQFGHEAALRADFPELVAGVLLAEGITPDADVPVHVAEFTDRALARLGGGTESTFPEIQAWRRAFSRMGLKPTQYRCASEALLRRLRSDGALPRVHPLVDLCNAVSVAAAVPIAPFDLANVAGDLLVRRAIGQERYEAFNGGIEHPEPGEVVFADRDGWAHARRWTNRQSGRSAVRPSTTRVLIVTEALHSDAADDVSRIVDELATRVRDVWGSDVRTAILTADSPRAMF